MRHPSSPAIPTKDGPIFVVDATRFKPTQGDRAHATAARRSLKAKTGTRIYTHSGIQGDMCVCVAEYVNGVKVEA